MAIKGIRESPDVLSVRGVAVDVCMWISMATKDPELCVSDLADVLAALTEVAEPYHLGIQLKIDLVELDTIEKNHPGNITRQKTEVIKYWLRNSPDASWTTLANAVERTGGHAGLVKRLRNNCKEQRSEGEMETTLASACTVFEELLREIQRVISIHYKNSDDDDKPFEHYIAVPENRYQSLKSEVSWCSPHLEASVEDITGPPGPERVKLSSVGICREICEDRNVLLLGKMGHGKSTLGNKILNYDGCFKINNRKCPQMCQGSALLRSVSQHKSYEVKVYDHDGLFEGAISVEDVFSENPIDMNLVIFILKQGCSFDVFEREILEAIITKQKINRISVLVLTHCDDLSEEEREEMIEKFKRDHPSVAELMGKGILAVGLPDSSHIQPGSELSQRVDDDKKKLRQLIYSCDKIVSNIIIF